MRYLIPAAVVVAAFPAAPATAAPTCRGKTATIVGTPGRDVVSGTRNKTDVIVTGRGSDRISRIGRRDIICSGPGADTIHSDSTEVSRAPKAVVVAGSGDDDVRIDDGTLVGGRGDDTLLVTNGSGYGGAGNDRVESQYGVVRGGRGHDRLVAADAIYGGPGDDILRPPPYCGPYLIPGPGDDVVYGGRGSCGAAEVDVDAILDLRTSPNPVRVNLAKGISTGWGRDRLRGIRSVIGSRHDDILVGGDGRDELRGAGGDDTIAGGLGADMLMGDGFSSGGGAGSPGADTVRGGSGHDYLAGDGGADRLFGGRSPDFLVGGPGSDHLNGGRGDRDAVTFFRAVPNANRGVTVNLETGRARGHGRDTLHRIEVVEGTRFDDILIGDAADNTFLPLNGDDQVKAGPGDDLILENAPRELPPSGDDRYRGGTGIDTVSWKAGGEAITVDLSKGTASGSGSDTLAAIEIIFGSYKDDWLIGDDGDNKLFGDGGDDFLDGRGGIDYLNGGSRIDICLNGEELNECP